MPQQVIRLLIAFALFISIFLVAAAFLKPESFGEFGHYRGDALREIAAKEIKFVDIKTCTECHKANADVLAEAEHSTINCQTCHGPGYKHNKWFEENRTKYMVMDSMTNTWTIDSALLASAGKTAEEFMLLKPDDRESCLKCHDKNAARREKVIRQIDINDHYDIKKKCVKCHPPHAPNS